MPNPLRSETIAAVKATVPGLARAGVPQPRIHYGFFGPAAEVLLSA